jgi:hypothetical protein
MLITSARPPPVPAVGAGRRPTLLRRPAVFGAAPDNGQLPPPGMAASPGVRQDLRRRPAGTLLHPRTTGTAARLCLYFPSLTVTAYVHVTTPTQSPVPVPPMALDSHLPTVLATRRSGQLLTILRLPALKKRCSSTRDWRNDVSPKDEGFAQERPHHRIRRPVNAA